MFYKITCIIFFIIIFGFNLCSAEQEFESQIGPFKFGRESLRESELISEYGSGYFQINELTKQKTHTYFDPVQQVYVEIGLSHVLDANLEADIEEVLVTQKNICDKKFKPKKPFGLLITSRGIKIADSIEKVIKAYGKPSDYNIRMDVDGLYWQYLPERSDELGLIKFYINNNRVSSILISFSE